MTSREYSNVELKVLILNFLERRGRWGKNYFPLHTMINWLSSAVKNDGKRVKNCIKSLVKENFVLVHKKGNVISLSPRKKVNIIELIDKFLRP